MVFKNPEIEQDINVCKQLLEAGLIQPTGNKIQEIFQKVANFSLKINREKPEQACKSTTKKKKKKWFDNECHQLRQKSRTLSKKKHNNPYDLEIRNKHRSILKKYINLCRKKMLAHQNKEIEKLDEATNNLSLFWDIWKNVGEEKEKTPPKHGNKWGSFFKNLCSETEEIDRLRPNTFL